MNPSYASSLSSSVKNYKYEPNDKEEQDRMDLLHHIYLLLLGGELHLAPIAKNPQRVLELGTGTGIWAIQFADEYPSAQVIGTDLSPIQPPWVPPNCTFEIDDFENDCLYKTKFDFIHAHDDTIKKAENCQLLLKNLHTAANKFGKTLDNVHLWKEKVEKAGFVDVKESVFKVPIGPWPKDPKLKEIGRYQQYQQIQALEFYTPALLSRVLGWNNMEIQVILSKAQSELKDHSIHLYTTVHYVYGRKP
ncbi:UMTA methyltransferase family protein [Rasamsonia emersonii CBS 393.64]|uniref:UMTA methyltransferase family protein n=1 Tax=Rasamsonia emersonii (strain ATCC 16479 / CBS 393.64 / IMI 116815) TaxID=1408163 RepID=A0A0F4YR46_RASE3|nr:UMTA methyltransferase family protein [Rasamsonia emersonii CBS 393.64]KKA20747.1 UMTA methyltransferase family protein [Rasamsonia emersonii CBS 393.64]